MELSLGIIIIALPIFVRCTSVFVHKTICVRNLATPFSKRVQIRIWCSIVAVVVMKREGRGEKDGKKIPLPWLYLYRARERVHGVKYNFIDISMQF